MSLLKKISKRYDELIVVEDVSLAGGGARPVYNYYNRQLVKKEKNILLIRMVYKNSLLKLIYCSFLTDKILINSVICFKYWAVILICYLKKNTVIYVHDTAPHIVPFSQKYPAKFKHFLRLLNRRKVGFVSEWQAEYFLKKVDIPRYKVIYNTINFPYEKPAGNMITLAMIGYQSEYKNVSFFSKVADEAYNQKLPYKFIWIGGKGGDTTGFYYSEHVEWLGNQDQVMDILNQVDVFLFTSHTDSFPLVFAEALFKGKRIVSYTENGFATHIAKLSGCKLYNSLNEKLAINMVKEVLKEPVDIIKHKELAYDLCSIENFEKRLEELFAE